MYLVLLQHVMPCLVAVPGRPALFLRGHRVGVDLAERRGGGERLREGDGGETVVGV